MAKKIIGTTELKSYTQGLKGRLAAKSEVDALKIQVDAIEVPTKVSELTNDSNFQTDTQVSASIASAVAGLTGGTFQMVDELPDPSEASTDTMYLKMNTNTGHYDIYMLINGSLTWIDDVSVDVSNFVEKEDGKGLSTNDFTTEDKTKLDSIEFATTEEVTTIVTEVFETPAV